MAQVQVLAFRGSDMPDAIGSEDDSRRPTIVANPPDDAEFRALITAFLMSGGRRAEDLEAALRRIRRPSSGPARLPANGSRSGTRTAMVIGSGRTAMPHPEDEELREDFAATSESVEDDAQ